VLILAAAAVVAIIAVSYFYTQHQNQNYASQVQFGSSWHYIGNTTEHFNDICPDSGVPISCVGDTNLPATIQEWANGTVIAYVGHISYSISAEMGPTITHSYTVVIINNSTYCVAPKVSDRPGCPPVIN
jgi:hypothetical protein